MRFEIVVPDNTRPELQAKFLRLTQQLSAHPELVEDFLIDEEDAIQSMFTSERLAHIDGAIAQVNGGDYFTSEQVKEHFAKKESAWIRRDAH